jgi:hypothetical protein
VLVFQLANYFVKQFLSDNLKNRTQSIEPKAEILVVHQMRKPAFQVAIGKIVNVFNSMTTFKTTTIEINGRKFNLTQLLIFKILIIAKPLMIREKLPFIALEEVEIQAKELYLYNNQYFIVWDLQID